MTTVEHLIFRWSPTGYAIEVKPGDPPPAGGSVHDGAGRFLVTKVASSPLPRDTRACAYLLPASVSRNGPDDGVHGGLEGATPVWTEPRGDLAYLRDLVRL